MAGMGLATLAVAGLDARPLAAQDVAIPVEVHLPLLMKILTFDRSLPMKVQGEVVIGLLYQDRYRASSHTAGEVRAAAAVLPADVLGGFPVRLVPIDLDQTGDVGAALARHRFHALYLTPMRGVDLDVVLRASRAAKIVTLTGVPRYVETGVAVGIDRVRERPQIVINVDTSRAEGADFTAQLLKLARIVREEEGT